MKNNNAALTKRKLLVTRESVKTLLPIAALQTTTNEDGTANSNCNPPCAPTTNEDGTANSNCNPPCVPHQ
jgi:hypothetical protein